MGKYTDKQVLAEAARRGFKSGTYFFSATGVSDCLVSGTLMVKHTGTKDKEDIENDFDGDVVSTGGYGLIYSASKDVWGVPMGDVMVCTGKNGANARRVSSKALK